MPAAAIGYTGIPAFWYHGWGGYKSYRMPDLLPTMPPVRFSHGRGSSSRQGGPLGVQGAGSWKRSAAPAQGAVMQGRGHTRGHGGRAWGGRNRKNLTKEALDADLDEWRMKDKKFGGHSLDADLDEYWKKKHDDDETQKEGEVVKDD